MDWVKGFLALWVVLHIPVRTFAADQSGDFVLSREGQSVVTLETVPVKETRTKMQAGALVIDVRTPEEFERGHIEDAVNVPHTQITNNLASIGYDKGRSIVLYCASGRRAGLAKAELSALGYTGVVNGGRYRDLIADR